MDVNALKLSEDRCTAKSDHYSASSEDSDSSKNSIMPPPKLHVRKHKALQSTTEGHTRSSSEDSILDGQPKLTTQTADLIPPADHPNFGVIVFAGNFSGTEEYPIVAVSDHKEEENLQLKKTIEQLKKENEEQQREISMKDDKIKELEQTNKELLKKPKGGIISQISQIRRRRHSYTNRTNLSPLNKHFSNEL